MQKLTDAQDLIAEARRLDADWASGENVSLRHVLDTATDLADALESVTAEYAEWREGIGVSEHLALREENKRLRAEITELREREKQKTQTQKKDQRCGNCADRTQSGFPCDKLGTDNPTAREWCKHWRPLPATDAKERRDER